MKKIITALWVALLLLLICFPAYAMPPLGEKIVRALTPGGSVFTLLAAVSGWLLTIVVSLKRHITLVFKAVILLACFLEMLWLLIKGIVCG